MDKEIALKKILHYCDYQDRCKKEIFTKLNSFELADDDRNFIVGILNDEGYISDERYCRSYVKSKLSLKKWGVNKIKLSLITKGIDREIIDNVLSEIDQKSYKEELVNLLKNKKINEEDPYKRKAKLIRYAVSKGYSISEVMEALGG
ncbi:MAG: RecX family transcriptional regulator [Bacteroidales bacterium]|nr:RecX family transcriptional regulator [Bacteroidales bacterium]